MLCNKFLYKHANVFPRLSSGAMQCEMHIFTTMGNNIKNKNKKVEINNSVQSEG